MRIGRKLLDYALFKIAELEFNDSKLYGVLCNNFSNIIIEQLGFSDTGHLAMCIGEIGINNDYQLLTKMEP